MVRKANKSLKDWVAFIKKVQKEEKLSYPDAMKRAKVRKDKGEKWKIGGRMDLDKDGNPIDKYGNRIDKDGKPIKDVTVISSDVNNEKKEVDDPAKVSSPGTEDETSSSVSDKVTELFDKTRESVSNVLSLNTENDPINKENSKISELKSGGKKHKTSKNHKSAKNHKTSKRRHHTAKKHKAGRRKTCHKK